MSIGTEMSPQIENPFVGPRAFSESDARSFFGRDQETQDIVNLIIANPTLLLYSPSGAGKSSLMQTSILPTLKKEGYEVWPVGRVRARFGSHENSFDSIENIYIYSVLANWEEDDSDLSHTTFETYLAAKEPPLDKYGERTLRIIVIDQFEELFTNYPQNWQERDNFIEQLGNSLRADPFLRIIFSLREEYLGQIDTYAHLLPGGLRIRFRLEHLSPEKAKRALEGPILRTHKKFDDGVVDSLINELISWRSEEVAGKVKVSRKEFVEPVQLQTVAYQLWQNLPSNVTTITSEDLAKYGNVNEFLINFYEEAIQRVSIEAGVGERKIREWFSNVLITPAGTRGLVYQGETDTAGLPNEAISLLNQAYLIRAEYRGGSAWFELAHDRLIETIKQSNDRWRLEYRRSPDYIREQFIENLMSSNKNIFLWGIFTGVFTGVFLGILGTLLFLAIFGR